MVLRHIVLLTEHLLYSVPHYGTVAEDYPRFLRRTAGFRKVRNRRLSGPEGVVSLSQKFCVIHVFAVIRIRRDCFFGVEPAT